MSFIKRFMIKWQCNRLATCGTLGKGLLATTRASGARNERYPLIFRKVNSKQFRGCTYVSYEFFEQMKELFFVAYLIPAALFWRLFLAISTFYTSIPFLTHFWTWEWSSWRWFFWTRNRCILLVLRNRIHWRNSELA
jgi:hypothetical protein